ncbi:hypothetical protein B1207_15185 [Legionella quinlivanii]|uniref:Uncharacterized protein n=1 Tax=Legionella quinlivanii TaxID=45073 RepID=A0A364LFC1_9GAMM|nr:hypothetical protein [Legionella quinlivanii]RAP34625.1 hypothetical protein B1207_15185 [Legionella quinlivanii]
MNFYAFLSAALWPLTIVFLTYYFGSDISKLLSRIKLARWGQSSAEFESHSQEQDIIKEAISDAGNFSDVPQFYESQNELMNTLLNNLTSEEAVKEYCRRNFPIIFLNFIFYKIYQNIFGTQLELLFYLNSMRSTKSLNLRQFYLKGKEQYPDVYHNITLEAYLSFLINNGLMQEQNGIVTLTSTGRDFIKFLNYEQLPPRPF